MDKILFGLIGFPSAFLLIIYRANIKQFSGDIGFAEKWFGSGGTYTLYILLGVFIFIITLMYVTGTLQNILYNTFGPIFFVR